MVSKKTKYRIAFMESIGSITVFNAGINFYPEIYSNRPLALVYTIALGYALMDGICKIVPPFSKITKNRGISEIIAGYLRGKE